MRFPISSNFVRNGNLVLSTIGPHANLNVYGIVVITNSPITVLLAPDSLSQIDSVERVRRNGIPLEKPKKNTDIFLLSK